MHLIGPFHQNIDLFSQCLMKAQSYYSVIGSYLKKLCYKACKFECRDLLVSTTIHLILMELFSILLTSYYSRNYSGIMYACLTHSQKAGMSQPGLKTCNLVIFMLNKNTRGVKKCRANQKQHCKQAQVQSKGLISAEAKKLL